ncbi:MAG TPA: glycosyltransferase family 4 protein [Balneolales bacterium]|nr:glycosyltransferase family 4 protein [Balneolales bacterium]
MKVHLVSETPFVRKGNGVHTAFIETIKLLKERNDIDVVVNGEGQGDVFHCHTYGPYYFWKGMGYKGRRIHTAHVIPDSIKGSLPMWKYWMPFTKWYFKKVFSYADVIIALSPTVEQEIKKLGVNRRIEKIYNPIFIDRWKRNQKMRRKGREILGLKEDEFVVLGVGQLQPRKGIEDFIDVAKELREAKFVWVGGRPFGALTEAVGRINSKIASASKYITFPGMLDLDEMPYIYAAADVFLFPSYQENCPLAPLEAAASGMPVIFRDIKEYRSLYENPYLRASTNEEFVRIIKHLMNEDDYYQKGVKTSEKLVSQFDKNNICEKLVTLYRSVVNKSYSKAESYTKDGIKKNQPEEQMYYIFEK